jgi:LDH2 family malate/lactate/ureidoglycolate dehydrogenase
LEEFKDRMDAYLHGLRETKTAPGEERVIYAGVLEHEAEVDRRANGIPYHPEVVEWFRRTAAELGAQPSLP